MATALVQSGVQFPDNSIRSTIKYAQMGIFGYGSNTLGNFVNTTNKVNRLGTLYLDTTGVGTARNGLAGAGYGGDKAIFGYGQVASNYTNITNLISNLGVAAADVNSVGTARAWVAAAGYGVDKAIFGFGITSNATTQVSTFTYISNTGAYSSESTTANTGPIVGKDGTAAAGYGGDKALFYSGRGYASGFGITAINLVSNTGVVASDSASPSGSYLHAGASYGGDKAIFGFGSLGGIKVSTINLVSNLGVMAAQTTSVGTARNYIAAAGYGGDKAIFGFGQTNTTVVNITNLVSNLGVVAADTSGIGTANQAPSGASYFS